MTDKLRTLLTGKNSIRGATGLLVVTLTISNILGLLRDRFLAGTIPAGELDSYYAAFRLPDLLTNLIVVGAIAVAFLPLFTELRAKDEQEAWAAANSILRSVVLVLIGGAIILIVGMPYFMPLVVPEFSADKLADTVRLARLLSLTPIFFGVSYLLSGILNSFQRFAVYSLTPLVYNASIIIATLLSARYAVDDRIMVVATGVVFGAIFHMLIQVPLAARLGWRWREAGSLSHPAVTRLRRLMVPRMIGLFGNQLSLIVVTAIASGWTGAITYYNLANNIQTMPTVIFANSIATAVFPTLSSLAVQKAETEFRAQLAQAIRWVTFLLIPAAAGLILLRIQIVRLILGSGFFDWTATQVTADVLGWFAVSLVASGLVPILARAFYARQDMKTPMTIALVSSAVTITLAYLLPMVLPVAVRLSENHLIHLGEVAALAIAFSAGMFVNVGLLLNQATVQFQLNLHQAVGSLVKIVTATAIMAAGVQLAKIYVGTHLDLDLAVNILIQTIAAVIIGVVVYLVAVSLLGVPEWHELKKFVQKKASLKTSTGLD